MNNNTSDSSGYLGSSNISGFGMGIGISIGILLLITTITLTSYFCTRSQVPAAPRRRTSSSTGPQFLEPHHTIVDVGLDEATIMNYPKMLFSEAKLRKSDSTPTSCSICLGDYKSSDVLRVLPDCEHVFHLNCIDPWLRLHPTCPLCRTSPIPTPLSTPLAEVVPLATRRD
ncbi:RING-H2 finger protein ATL70 [Vigna unguiculata]|uniref:RING-type E3 ubiquitin transferase n=1 Tax=Vigna unguiculata TaxID=3917 RepID=A0A4D6MXE4_VIGUN|nr:RING-H2 finger protein ATL70 [Vigna unguiculata]QCE05361.1 E3 ubiquitin-protein ligase [Vigna unguiculata]